MNPHLLRNQIQEFKTINLYEGWVITCVVVKTRSNQTNLPYVDHRESLRIQMWNWTENQIVCNFCIFSGSGLGISFSTSSEVNLIPSDIYILSGYFFNWVTPTLGFHNIFIRIAWIFYKVMLEDLCIKCACVCVCGCASYSSTNVSWYPLFLFLIVRGGKHLRNWDFITIRIVFIWVLLKMNARTLT